MCIVLPNSLFKKIFLYSSSLWWGENTGIKFEIAQSSTEVALTVPKWISCTMSRLKALMRASLVAHKVVLAVGWWNPKLGFLTLNLGSFYFLFKKEKPGFFYPRPQTGPNYPKQWSHRCKPERKPAPNQATATTGKARSGADPTASGAWLLHRENSLHLDPLPRYRLLIAPSCINFRALGATQCSQNS